jgi:hypothetical protein
MLFWLLTVVSQSRSLALAITTVYCASPLLVPGSLWLAASSNLLTAQIFVIVVYLAHTRHAQSGQLRWSLVAGLALVGGVAFWEKTAITALLLVILSLGWLATGSLRGRVAALFRDWRGWALTLGPLAAFTAYFFSHGYGRSARDLPVHAAAHLVWMQWSHTLWPAVIGAPWHWFSGAQTYTGLANPRPITVILGQCAFGLLVIAGWLRNRWKGLLAFALPIVAVVVGELLVGIGRYADFGDIPALQFNYAFDLAVPMALAVALALGSSPLSEVTRPVTPRADVVPVEPTGLGRRRVALAIAGVTLLVSSGVVSAFAWTSRWHQSPAKTYVATLLTSIRQIGPSANIFDTGVSTRVLPSISPNRNLSDLLSLTDARVAFDRGVPQPELVVDSGRIVPATFLSAAHQVVAPNAFCPTLVAGTTSRTVPLAPRVGRSAYFLRIEYFEQRPALVTVTVKDRTGADVALRRDPTVEFDQKLGVVLLPLETGSPQQVRLASSSEATRVCMSTITVGAPVAAQP